MRSRFTEPGRFAPMLDELPDDPRAIAAVARAQTIHHNLLAYFGVVGDLRRVWPPRFDAILGALAETPPRTLSIERPPDELASLLAEQRLEELADFYRARPELRLEGAGRDRHSLVFEG
jgi:hypothetical protein